MYALFVVLNDTSKLENIHNILYDNECGATTVDSMGMGKVLLQHEVDVPIFAGLRKLVEGNKPYNKTIFSVIRSEEKLRKTVDAIKDEIGLTDDSKRGIGFIFVLPVIECHGYKVDPNERDD